MRLANPAGLWLALLAVPIVLLHVLRPRRPAVEVPSTYLWRDASQPVSSAVPWQRLRPSLLLVLQLLAVALLALAAARPVRLTGEPLARHTVFVVDASGSMAALDGDPDRLSVAKERVRHLRRQLPSGGLASIVVASSQPRVVLSASPDGGAFGEAIGAIRSQPARADFASALTLAASLETPGAPVGVVLLSDGGLTDAEKRLLPAGTSYVRIGDRSTNRAITRLTVEPRGSGLHARVALANTGGPAATQVLRVDVDGKTAWEGRVRLGRGAIVEREVDLPTGDRVEAFLEGEDLLAADNHAFAVAGRRRPLKVVVAGPENLFLDRLLSALPAVTVERVAASRPAPGADLVVYDRVPVPADPGAPFLAIAPPGGMSDVKVRGATENPAVTLVRADDSLLQGLDLSEVAISGAQRIEAPGDEVLVAAEGTPLLVRGTRHGRPFAYLGFGLDDSNLPVQVAFPVLGDRLVSELSGASLTPPDLRAGDPLPVASGTVLAPAGRSFEVAPGSAPPVADRAGFWTVHEPGRPARHLAVNAHPAESRLAPEEALPTRPRPAAGGEARARGEIGLLPWVAAALLALLAAELFVSSRTRAVPRRQWRMALAGRAVIAGLLIAALAGVELPRTGKRVATMFLVDASDSLGPGGKEAAVEWVRDSLAEASPDNRAGVAFFGGDARLELTVQPAARLQEPSVQVDTTRTNLAGALRLAGAVLPSDSRRRIVVVSDGRATEGDAAVEAQRLRQSGVRVDVHTVARASGPDVAVARLEAPSLARQGESFNLRAVIEATVDGPARLTLQRDGQVIDERIVELRAGENVVDLPQTVTTAGLVRYRLDVTAPADAVRENDVAFAAVQVEGPARVLLVEGATGNSNALGAALRSGGVHTDTVAAAQLPALDRLTPFTAVVLVDVDARSLSAAQVGALSAAARDLGKGLVAIGGDRSFALGGYLNSELEKVLPVISEIKDPKRRASVAEVLAIDTSGSMGTCHCNEGANGMAFGGNRSRGGVNKTDISRQAAARTIEALNESDQIGVLAFNTDHDWVVPLQRLPSEDVVRKGLRGLKPEGGTDLTSPLLEAAEALKGTKARLKHIILFSDGFTAKTGLEEVRQQAEQLASEGITVSVLATGEGAAAELKKVAEAGKGRFYPGRDLAEIPQIMVEEAMLAARNFVNEGEFFPKVSSAAAPVRDLRSSPPILGYLAATAKPTAETLLRIGDEDDPLLASWRVGLGRVTAWTSDASARWSARWAGWPGYVGFWTAVVKDTFPLGGGAGAGVRADVVGDRLRISVESEQPWPDGAAAVARVAGPDLAGREVPLERASPNAFTAEVPASAAGSYAVGASVSGPGGAVASMSTLATQSYSPEYRPGAAEPETLARVSRLSGGRGEIRPAQVFDAAGLPVGHSRIPLAGWLLLAAALLWPVAVALQRVTFAGTGAATARAGAGRVASGLRVVVSRLRARLPARPGRVSTARPEPGPEPVPESGPEPAGHPPRARQPVPAPPATVGRLLERKRAGPRAGEPSPSGEPDGPGGEA